MKKFYLLLIGLLFLSYSLKGEIFADLNVTSDGKIYLSPVTDTNVRYVITIEGTYSMWPQFTDCHGVDAAYVYDVPPEEINSFRWPPLFLMPLPIWVGDPTEIPLPTIQMSFRKHKGFRIDGEPLPNSGIDMMAHRYRIEKMGTGKPFEFQIIDSNYNILQERVIPRYEDNCGSLKVRIEKIGDSTGIIDICKIESICKDGIYIGIKLWAAIFAKDTNSISGQKNLLKNINPNQIGIVEDGKFRCDIDSIVCNTRTGAISIGLLMDRSGSMALPISESDPTIRMEASKSAINSFIDNLQGKDSAFVMSFSNDVRLDQDWTNNKNLLKQAINNLNPESKTQFYGAVLQAINKVSLNSNPIRTLVVLSDGANTYPPDWDPSFLDIIQKKNIPIYIVALGLSNEPEDIEGRKKMGLIADASKGKVYDVNNAKLLDSVYKKLSEEISEDECCIIYFKIDKCPLGTEKFIRLIYAPQDTTILTKVIKFKCDTCLNTSIFDKKYEPDIIQMNIAPNPFDHSTNLFYTLYNSGIVKIGISSILGNDTQILKEEYQDEGKYIYSIDGNKLQSGIYVAFITQNGITISRKIIIIH